MDDNRKKIKLVIEAWPKLIEALESPRLAILGTTPQEVAKFLIIKALDDRQREQNATAMVKNACRAAGVHPWD